MTTRRLLAYRRDGEKSEVRRMSWSGSEGTSGMPGAYIRRKRGNTRIEVEHDSEPRNDEMEAKLNWLKSIGAAEFPEPIKYIYTFPDYNGAFNLSERYIEEKTLEELKAQYEKNKVYVQEIIRSKKSRDDFLRGAEPL